MKRRYIFLFLIIFTVLTVFADGNYFYYRSSEGEDAGAFPNIGENPGGPGGGGGFPIPGDWLVFSEEGNLFLHGSSKIKGRDRKSVV